MTTGTRSPRWARISGWSTRPSARAGTRPQAELQKTKAAAAPVRSQETDNGQLRLRRPARGDPLGRGRGPRPQREVLVRNDTPALDPARTVVFTGIGTSLHAARVAADWVTQMTGRMGLALAVDAHDLGSGALPLTGAEQVVVISHRGYKIYPTASLERARAAGCTTIAVVGLAAPEQAADHVMRTCANETAGTFSVSYLASLAALARLVAPFDRDGAFSAALPSLPEALAQTLARPLERKVAEDIAVATPILITGFAGDLVTAQEAALKIKEGTWLWTEAMSRLNSPSTAPLLPTSPA
ncbi:MAG: SIS domain-containing protein [Sneathiellaceae bacterium]